MKVAPGEDTSRQNASSAEQPSGSHDFPLAWQQPLMSNGSILINAGVINLLLSSYGRYSFPKMYHRCTEPNTPPPNRTNRGILS